MLSSYRFKGVSLQLKVSRARKLGREVFYRVNQMEKGPRALGDAAAFLGKRRDAVICLQLFRKKIFLILCIFDFSKVFLICTGMNPSFLEILAKNLLVVWQER